MIPKKNYKNTPCLCTKQESANYYVTKKLN